MVKSDLKKRLLPLVNACLALLFLIQTVSIALILFSVGPSWIYLLHTVMGLAFIVLGFIHVWLNASWIASQFKKKPAK